MTAARTTLAGWTRDGAPRYVRQISRGRTARITKVRRPVEFTWEATITTARGDSYIVCREPKMRDCAAAFEQCAAAGVTRYGRPIAAI